MKSRTYSDHAVSKFLLQLIKEQQANGINNDVDSLLSDQRRLVFVSLLGLFQTYRKCPMPLLHSSLFILPLEQQWVEHPAKHWQELDQKLAGKLSQAEPTEVANFLLLLKWKSQQNLLFCTESNYDDYRKVELIAPFWQFLDLKLVSMNLNGLQSLWDDASARHYKSKYNTKYKDLLLEFYFLQMRFKCLQEILFLSNPHSLNPITSYVASTSTSRIKPAELELAIGSLMQPDHKEEKMFNEIIGCWHCA